MWSGENAADRCALRVGVESKKTNRQVTAQLPTILTILFTFSVAFIPKCRFNEYATINLTHSRFPQQASSASEVMAELMAMVAEKSSTNNEIVRAMKLEQKGFTWKKGLEVNASARLPKVNFISRTERRK
jgi:hypothetical protein